MSSAAPLADEAPKSFWMPPKPAEVDRWPDVNPNFKPVGHRVLVQVRRTSEKIEGSSLLATENTQGLQQYKCQIGRLIAVGSNAYKDRETSEPWKSGPWAKVGDYVRIPAHGGDRWSVIIDGDHSKPVAFALLNDDNILGIVSDPNAD